MRICPEICFQHNSASALDSLPFQHLRPPPVLSSFTPVSLSEADTHTSQWLRGKQGVSLMNLIPFIHPWVILLRVKSPGHSSCLWGGRLVVLKLLNDTKGRLVRSWLLPLLRNYIVKKGLNAWFPNIPPYNVTTERILELEGSLG